MNPPPRIKVRPTRISTKRRRTLLPLLRRPRRQPQAEKSSFARMAKPILGVTYPSDWTQKATDNSVTAVSGDKHAWSAVGIMDGVKDKQAGINKIKQGLEKYLTGIDYDDPTETERGTLMVTGTGKTKKAGVDVVFATGAFEPAPGQFAGVAFIVDNNLDDQYKETVRYICQTIRGADDLGQ